MQATVTKIRQGMLNAGIRAKLDEDFSLFYVEIQGNSAREYFKSKILDIMQSEAAVLSTFYDYAGRRVFYITAAGWGNAGKIQAAINGSAENRGELTAVRETVFANEDIISERTAYSILLRALPAIRFSGKKVFNLTAGLYELAGGTGHTQNADKYQRENETVVFSYGVTKDLVLGQSVRTLTRLSAFRSWDENKSDVEYQREMLGRYGPAYACDKEAGAMTRSFDENAGNDSIYIFKKSRSGRNTESFFHIPSNEAFRETLDEFGDIVSSDRTPDRIRFEESRAMHLYGIVSAFNETFQKYGIQIAFSEAEIIKTASFNSGLNRKNDAMITANLAGKVINVYAGDPGLQDSEDLKRIETAVNNLGTVWRKDAKKKNGDKPGGCDDRRFKGKDGLPGIRAVTGAQEDRNEWNICLIYGREHYSGLGIPDPYGSSRKGTAQHVTHEMVSEAAGDSLNSVIKNCIFQLMVKDDLQSHHISLFDTSALPFAEITFIAPVWKTEEKGASAEYFVMDIDSPTGNFEIFKWDENSFLDIPEYDRYEGVIDHMCVGNKSRYAGDRTEYAVMLDGNVNIVRKTDIRVLPNESEMNDWKNSREIRYLKENGKFSGTKGKEAKERAMSGMLDASVLLLDGRIYYTVGAKSTPLKNSSLERASLLYAVDTIDETSEIIIDKIACMMCVDFIRNGQLTTLPFPIKYIREFAKAEDFES